MAHFAKLDGSNTVVEVVVVDNVNAPDPAPSNSESAGIAYLNSVGLSGNWVQTSYHGSFRKQYAGIGFSYDSVNDVFISPQPYPSWNLDDNFDWQPPVPMPTTQGPWFWDEETQSWTKEKP